MKKITVRIDFYDAHGLFYYVERTYYKCTLRQAFEYAIDFADRGIKRISDIGEAFYTIDFVSLEPYDNNTVQKGE